MTDIQQYPAGVDIRSYSLGAEYGAIVAVLGISLLTEHEVTIDPDNLLAVEAAAESMGWGCESTPTGIFAKLHIRFWRDRPASDCQGERLTSIPGASEPKRSEHLRVVK